MGKLKLYIQLLRPRHFIKNGFVFLPCFFGGRLLDIQAMTSSVLAFVGFCMAAGTIYILNDINDASADRLHPVKKNRPLASKQIKPANAWIFLVTLFLLTIVFSFIAMPFEYSIILIVYLLVNLLYSTILKKVAVVDIVCVSSGFVLRVLAGGYSSGTAISHWIIIMTFLLALFLALAKRRDDLIIFEGDSTGRKSLDGYNMEFVSYSMVIMASVIIVSYILYTVSPEVIAKHGTANLYITGFWVVIGILRYMQLTFVANTTGSPTMVLFKDILLQAIIVSWSLNFFLIIYFF